MKRKIDEEHELFKGSQSPTRLCLRQLLHWAVSLLLIGLSASVVQAGTVVIEIFDDGNSPLNDVVIALFQTGETKNFSFSDGENAAKDSLHPRENLTAIMDQKNNTFVPRVMAVKVNTLVRFPNSDNIRHHVYSFSPTKRFELRLYHGVTAEPVLFDRPGQVVLGCNIHDSMLGYIYVVDSEYYGLSDKTGAVTIQGLPPGDYRLEIQHPLLDPTVELPMQFITVKENTNTGKKIILPKLLPDPRSISKGSELENLFKR